MASPAQAASSGPPRTPPPCLCLPIDILWALSAARMGPEALWCQPPWQRPSRLADGLRIDFSPSRCRGYSCSAAGGFVGGLSLPFGARPSPCSGARPGRAGSRWPGWGLCVGPGSYVSLAQRACRCRDLFHVELHGLLSLSSRVVSRVGSLPVCWPLRMTPGPRASGLAQLKVRLRLFHVELQAFGCGSIWWFECAGFRGRLSARVASGFLV